MDIHGVAKIVFCFKGARLDFIWDERLAARAASDNVGLSLAWNL